MPLEPGTVVRSASRTVQAAVAAAGVTLSCWYLGSVLELEGAWRWSVPAVGVAIAAHSFWHYGLCRLVVQEDGLRIVNPTGTEELTWGEMLRVELVGVPAHRPMVFVAKRGSGSARIQVLEEPGLVTPGFLAWRDRRLADLQATIDHRRPPRRKRRRDR